MWPFERSVTRRREIRRSRAERGLVWYQRIGEHLRVRPMLLTLLSAIITAIVVTIGGDVLDLRQGQWMPRTLTARTNFRVEDPQQTAALRIRAGENAPDYYVLDAGLIDEIRGKLQNLPRLAREFGADQPRLLTEAARFGLTLDETALSELPHLLTEGDGEWFAAALDAALDILIEQPLVDADTTGSRGTALQVIFLRPDAPERTLAARELIFNDAEGALRAARAAAAAFPEPLRASVTESLSTLLRVEKTTAVRPIHRYDNVRSTEAARAAASAVPMQYVEYAQSYQLADVGPLSDDELRLVREEFLAYQSKILDDPERSASVLTAMRARGVLAFLVVMALGGYIALYREPQLRSSWRQALIAVLLIGDLLVVRAAFVQTGVAHYAVGGQAFAAAILSIIHPQGSIFAICGMLALLMGLATQQGVSFFIVLLSVSLVTLLGLKDIRNRGKIVFVGCAAAATALLTTLLTGLADGQTLAFAFWHQAVPAMLTTLAAAFLVEGILPAMERFFGITTSMTLLEWCDASKPLLRMMAAEAPGTYNHSLMVGTLAEAAAEAIGANGLLARTGAYYHDIGKINKPEYFVENQQMGMTNRHERLSPAMSHLIIIGHVKDGIAMAREYGVPAALHPFIAEHHGTTLVEYFYAAANRARRPDDPEIPEETYRYPGPRPQSRESAILLLCDGIEAAVRAMPEPTAGRIEDTVNKIVQKRLLDGQLDACELTFRELETIRRALIKSLCSIYHARIVYPTDEGAEPPTAVATRAS